MTKTFPFSELRKNGQRVIRRVLAARAAGDTTKMFCIGGGLFVERTRKRTPREGRFSKTCIRYNEDHSPKIK